MKLITYLILGFLITSLPALADEPARDGAADSAPTSKVEPPPDLQPPAKPVETVPTAPTASKKAEPQYTGEALELKNYIEKLFDYSKKVDATDAAEKSEARAKIEAAVDWDKISKDCIGPTQWKKQSAKNLAEFRKLLKDVILKTAFARIAKFWNGATYRFEKIHVNGKVADALVKFNVKGEGIKLGYNFRKGNGDVPWVIYDIAYEDLHYSKNINEQIETFLRDDNFASLLGKLRKRRDELEENTGKTKKS